MMMMMNHPHRRSLILLAVTLLFFLLAFKLDYSYVEIIEASTTIRARSTTAVQQHPTSVNNSSGTPTHYDDDDDGTDDDDTEDNDADKDLLFSLSDDDSFLSLPHVMYNDLRYRRVCATVHSSRLCLTVKYPFVIPLQDPTVSFPKPVLEQWYHPKNSSTSTSTSTINHTVVILDGNLLKQCNEIDIPKTSDDHHNMMDGAVKACLDLHDLQQQQKETTAGMHVKPTTTTWAVWTRTTFHTGKRTTSFFGTTSSTKQRVQRYFANQIVLIHGASPTPGIALCLSELFGTCQPFQRKDAKMASLVEQALCTRPRQRLRCRENHFICTPTATSRLDQPTAPGSSRQHEQQQRHLQENNTTTKALVLPPTNGRIFFALNSLYPNDTPDFSNHSISNLTSLADVLMSLQDHTNLSSFRVTSIIEHPLAHVQNEPMIQHSWTHVESLQHQWARVFTSAQQDDEQALLLQQRGIHLENIIAYDGSPQLSPSATGAHPTGILKFKSEQEFITQGGYPGWRPELGSKCRGPLPSTSKLTTVNHIGRQAYRQQGLDMRWYGRTWEFTNLLWFQIKGVAGWQGGHLDCTHGHSPGFTCLHKYFLMAMVEDHYDELEESSTNPNSDMIEGSMKNVTVPVTSTKLNSGP